MESAVVRELDGFGEHAGGDGGRLEIFGVGYRVGQRECIFTGCGGCEVGGGDVLEQGEVAGSRR